VLQCWSLITTFEGGHMKLVRVCTSVSFCLLGAVLLVSCGSEPNQPKAAEATKPVEKKEIALYTARPCLERMSNQALRWQPDALPYRLESESNAEANGQDGKSTVWRATFVSASRGLSKAFSCSGSLLKESPPLGVTADREFPNPRNIAILTFSPTSLVADSDTAAKLALEHGGADLVKKNPQQPVYYELGVDPKSNNLLWAAVFGINEKDNKGIGMIDATSNKFLGALKAPPK
jgi:hypothetical protein